MKPFMYPCFRNTLCCLLFVAGALVSVAAPTKIRVGYSYWLPNVPMDVAEAHGWFKEENLEVSFTRTETSQAVIAGLKNGELDLATDAGLRQPHGRQLLPQQGGHDGFYYAKLIKIAASPRG